MKIYRPLKSNYITQNFGESNVCIDASEGLWGKIDGVCLEGMKDLYASLGLKAHNGIDMACWYGEPIYHSGDFIGWAKTEIDAKGGKGVDVISESPQLNGGYVKLRYWHLKEQVVYDGQRIMPGQLIGYGDSTGLSGGNHLHWALKMVDKDGNTLNKNNGYYGAIPFGDMFENEFILVILNLQQQLSAYKKVVELLTKLLWLFKK